MSSTSVIYSRKKMFLFRTSFFIFFLSAFSFQSFAQFNVKITVNAVPPTHVTDSIFVAGNFNNWEPGNEKYKLISSNGTYSVNINGLKNDLIEFKFTRGNWNRTEVNPDGKDIANRYIKLISDTSIVTVIDGWKDDFAETNKKHSASANVSILDTAFYMPQLNRHRRIWVYLPDGYKKSKKKYPVLYMHDGQNLFDEFTASFAEWGIDEILDSLTQKGQPSCILIGIDNGPQRINEYNPYDNEKYGLAEGEAYVQFIVETLKPFIDNKFRTIPEKEKTFIAGSSLGGLISYYAMLKYPETFGKAGIFSPSFWFAPEIKKLTDSVGFKQKGQFFFYAGEFEGDNKVEEMNDISDKLGEISGTLIYTITDPVGKHNEAAWQKWFAEFYLWVNGNGLSYQINTVD